jgi:hypothetical protein
MPSTPTLSVASTRGYDPAAETLAVRERAEAFLQTSYEGFSNIWQWQLGRAASHQSGHAEVHECREKLTDLWLDVSGMEGIREGGDFEEADLRKIQNE